MDFQIVNLKNNANISQSGRKKTNKNDQERDIL